MSVLVTQACVCDIFLENLEVVTLSGSNKYPQIHSIRLIFAGGFNVLDIFRQAASLPLH